MTKELKTYANPPKPLLVNWQPAVKSGFTLKKAASDNEHQRNSLI